MSAPESHEPANPRPWKDWVAAFGFVLPYAVIVLAWSFAPDAVREHYDPDGDRIRNEIGTAVFGSAAFGVLLASPWAGSRPRSGWWWAGAAGGVLVQAAGVAGFNFCYYVTSGGAFP